MKTFIIFSLVFMFLCSQAFSQYLSEPVEWIYTLGYAEWEIELEDINNDGRADLISGNNYYNGNLGRIAYSLNTGSGIFSENWTIVSSASGRLVNALSKGNLRNSSDQDLVATYSNNTSEVIHNINNTLSVVQNNLPGGSKNALGRINNDIYDDLTIINTSGTEIKIFRNLGNGIFYTTPIQTISTSLYCHYIKIADLDHTLNFYDLVYLESDGLSSSIKIRKNSNGTFGNPTTINLPASSNYEVAVEDVNYDDYPDLITMSYEGVLKVFLNDGAGNIHTNADLSVQTTANWIFGDIEIGDINNDGWNDIVVSKYEGFTYVFINNRNTPLFNSSPTQSLYGIAPYETLFDLELSDIQNTGGLSALLAISNTVAIFYHSGNPAPAPPKNLTINKSGNNHPLLNWRPYSESDFYIYKVYRNGGGGYQYIGQTTNTYFEDLSLSYCTAKPPAQCQENDYSYYVKAVDISLNESASSNIVTVSLVGFPEKANSNKNHDVINEYSLGQNYPNPFNPLTKITYSIADDAFVQVKIYDLLGNEIKELVNESKSLGFYEVIFDASYLSSGVYIYTITAFSKDRIIFNKSKQMILLK